MIRKILESTAIVAGIVLVTGGIVMLFMFGMAALLRMGLGGY